VQTAAAGREASRGGACTVDGSDDHRQGRQRQSGPRRGQAPDGDRARGGLDRHERPADLGNPPKPGEVNFSRVDITDCGQVMAASAPASGG